MMISNRSLEVLDSSLPSGTPLVYEIEGGNLRGAVRGVVRVGEPAEFHVAPGVYEVSLVHPRLGRLSKLLDVGEEAEPVLFRDMKRHPLSRASASYWLAWWRVDRRGNGVLWGNDRFLYSRDSDARIACPDPQADVQAVTISDGSSSVAIRLPPGVRFLEIQLTHAGKTTFRPRTDNVIAESMLDYAMEGYPDHAKLVRGNANAYELIHREHSDLAGALIGAYYLLRIGEAEDCLPLLEELAQNFPDTPDATIAFASALLQHGVAHPLARAGLLRAVTLGVPFYRDGLKRLRVGLDFFYALSDGEDDDVRRAIEHIRPYQVALRYDNAVTSWTNRHQSLQPMVPAASQHVTHAPGRAGLALAEAGATQESSYAAMIPDEEAAD